MDDTKALHDKLAALFAEYEEVLASPEATKVRSIINDWLNEKISKDTDETE